MGKTHLNMTIESVKTFTKPEFNKIVKKLIKPYDKDEPEAALFNGYAQEHIKIELNGNGKITLSEKDQENDIGNYDSDSIYDAVENIIDEIPTMNGGYNETFSVDGSVRYITIVDSAFDIVEDFKDWDELNSFREDKEREAAGFPMDDDDIEKINKSTKKECFEWLADNSWYIEEKEAKKMSLPELRKAIIDRY